MGSILDYIGPYIGPIVVFVFAGLILRLLKGVAFDKPGVRSWLKRHIWPHWQWVVISAILLMAMSAFLHLWLTSPTPVGVQFTNVEIGRFSPEITVTGICEGIPQGGIWVLRFSRVSQRYYIQQRAVELPRVKDEPLARWQALAAYEVSQDDEMSCEFELVAVIADQEAELYFNDHLARGKREEGMEYLPKGAQTKDRIVVSLKGE